MNVWKETGILLRTSQLKTGGLYGLERTPVKTLPDSVDKIAVNGNWMAKRRELVLVNNASDGTKTIGRIDRIYSLGTINRMATSYCSHILLLNHR